MRERLLGSSGIRVSELCLGAMTFGTSWGWGAEEEECREIYRCFREAGGNFVDTANIYTTGESETIVGRLVAAHRDQVVLATKFGLPSDRDDPNSGGSHRKSLRRSLEASLRRLGTDYIDLLWVHAWDRGTPVEETLRALDDAVRAGKVLAIGVSNTPAWVVARSHAIADLQGWASFCSAQVEYSLSARSAERELLPMAESLGLVASAWSPLGRGLLAGKKTRADGTPPSASQREAARVAAEIAGGYGTSPARVALAWVLHRGVIPVLGASSAEQIRDNVGAAELDLTDGQLELLDAAAPVEPGYPHEFLRDRAFALAPPAYPRRR